jgi:chromosome segregation ATPase
MTIKHITDEIKQQKKQISNVEIEVENYKSAIMSDNQKLKNLAAEKRKAEKEKQMRQTDVNERQEIVNKLQHELSEIERDRKHKDKENFKLIEIHSQKQQDRETNDAYLEKLKINVDMVENDYKALKSEVQKLEKEIDQKMRERKLLNNDVVSAEANERLQKSKKQDLENQQTEQKNKIAACQAESNRLSKIIGNLSKEKEKYGVEASQANAKYYQCLEQVKLKNNLITKLQKKNVEQEYRLKQQQNLYEDVRSDRNLRSKQLMEAEEEISELKRQFKRMT